MRREEKNGFGTLLFSISERSRSGVFHALYCTCVTLMAYQASCEFEEGAICHLTLLHGTELYELDFCYVVIKCRLEVTAENIY